MPKLPQENKSLEQFSFKTGIIIILSCTLSIKVFGQDANEATSASSSLPNGNATDPLPLQMDLKICSKESNLSLIYCNCTEKVASCDFSSYPGSPTSKTDLRVFVDQIETPVKRVCICGSPSHLRLNLTSGSGFSSKLGTIHRVDVFNLKGPLLITDAFKSPFGGDFYMMNVSFLHSIRTLAFDRGIDMQIENVQDLECCSKINVSQHFLKPTLFMEFVQIGKVHSRGISSFHIWKTVILRYLLVTEIETRGISLDSTERVNISITNCEFLRVNEQGINLVDFGSAFIAKNYFYNESSSTALTLMSHVRNSSLVIVDNEFHNELIWDLSAQQVLIWLNMFDFWDNYTFSRMDNSTNFPGQVFSIEYNNIGHFLIQNESITFLSSNNSSKNKIVFNENVFGNCNCSLIHGVVLPPLISFNPSRCDSMPLPLPNSTVLPKPSESCLVNYAAMTAKCIDASTTITPSELCKAQGVKPESAKSLAFKATGANNFSPFIADMMKELKFKFHFHQAFANSEEEKSSSSKEIGKMGKSSHSSALIVFFIVLTIFLVSGVGYLFKIRRRMVATLITGNSRTDSYDILTTST